MTNRYWEEQYKKMTEEVGNTPAEREVLEKLGRGCAITDCIEETSLSLEEFFKLMERARAWETENLCSD